MLSAIGSKGISTKLVEECWRKGWGFGIVSGRRGGDGDGDMSLSCVGSELGV